MDSYKENIVSIVMGSQSDWTCMKSASIILKELNIQHEVKIISAYRTPDRLFKYAENLEKNGIMVSIAGAGGAAHLPGMIASKTIIPVLGVPVKSKNLNGIDSLLSIVQMPPGIPVATMAIGAGGARNAGILAVQILALKSDELRHRLLGYKDELAKGVEAKAERLSQVGYREYAKP